MKTTIEIQLNNFEIPVMVTEQKSAVPPVALSPLTPVRQYHLSELPADVLYDLCTQFSLDVFEKAGARLPEKTATQKMLNQFIAADEIWMALIEIGYPPDGETSIADTIRQIDKPQSPQWLDPNIIKPIHGEVYQVFNGMRYIAKYHETLGWYTESGSRRIDNVTHYATAAPMPE